MTTSPTSPDASRTSLEPANYLSIDTRPHLLTAIDLAAPVIEQADRHSQTAPTPCPDFDVAALLAHLHAVLIRINAVPCGKVREVPDQITSDDYALAWGAAAAMTRELWSAHDPDDQTLVPWRALTIREAAGMYAAEVVCHAWDLAVATGQDFDVPADLAGVCIAAYRHEIPPEQRAHIFNAVRDSLPDGLTLDQDPFAAALPIAEDAFPVEQVVAMSGRNPRWTAAD